MWYSIDLYFFKYFVGTKDSEKDLSLERRRSLRSHGREFQEGLYLGETREISGPAGSITYKGLCFNIVILI